MGATGVGHFENDAAADWLFDLESEGIDAVRAALCRAIEPESLDANEASEALAAAAVVASARDGNRAGLPRMAVAWLEDHQREITRGDMEQAARAVTRVASDSELSELWREANSEGWSAVVQDLHNRLPSAGEERDA